MNYKEIFDQLDYLGNIDLQLKCIDEFSLEEINKILSFTQIKRIKYIELYLPIIENIKEESLIHFLRSNLRVSKIVFYKCINLNDYRQLICSDLSLINFTEKDLAIYDGCGQICAKYFTLSQDFFLESKNFNNCLNGKLAIAWNGDLKNCLHLPKVYGNVSIDKIEKIILQKDFQEIWRIHKDLIIECKDCEFRYMCSDCRAYIIDKSNIYSKPRYCNYNPYKIEYK